MYLTLIASLLGSISALNVKGPYQCLASALLLVAMFPEFVGTHVSSSSSYHYPSSQQQHHNNNDNSVYIQSNISLQHSNHYYYQSGKRTMSIDYEDPRMSPKWQWVLKPSRKSSSSSHYGGGDSSVHERPVRHWWANLLHPRHQVSHNKRSAQHPVEPASVPTTHPPNHILHNSSQHQLPTSGPLYECIDHRQWPGLQTPHIMTPEGASEWLHRVCSANQLDQRVKELLNALISCPQHRVCQVLSPEELRNLSDDKTCRHEAGRLWKRFHQIFLVIRDFSDVFQEKFDTADYSVIFNSNQCQEAYNFWTCSIFLPLYLRHSESSETVTVRSCQSVCKEVEKTCPFLIKGLEDDKAAGNPSFLCKDDLVPNVMRASVMPLPCCYKAVVPPPPGRWLSFSLNSSSSEDQNFCQEPDQRQLENSTPAASLPNSAADLGEVFFEAQQLCDKIPSPAAAKLNITASEIGTSWYVWRQRLRDSNLLNQSVSREWMNDDEEDDFDLFRIFHDLVAWLAPTSTVNETTVTEIPAAEVELVPATVANSSSSSSSSRTMAWPTSNALTTVTLSLLTLTPPLFWTALV